MKLFSFTKKVALKYDIKVKNMTNFFFFFFCSKPKFKLFGHNSNSRNFILPYKISLFFIFTHSIKS